jgi:hypothetical protein
MRSRPFPRCLTVGRWSALALLWIAVVSCVGSSEPVLIPTPQTRIPPAPPVQKPTEPPSMAVPAPQPPLSSALPAIRFTIQVGAFSTSDRAARLAARLQAAGVDAYCFVDDDQLYKVRFERFDSREAAWKRAMELQSRELIGTFYIVHPNPATDDVDPKFALRKRIVQTARRFIGVPYHWGGVSRVDGFDCSGLTMTVYRLNGLELPRSAYAQYRAGTPVNRDALEPGDLVFFVTNRSRRVSHVGIYSGRNRFVHAPGRGKRIRSSSLSNRYFKRRYKGARRYF